MENLQVVWFKRDLRVADNAVLVGASARGPVLPLYIVEPGLWREDDAAGRHWEFIAESLHTLQRDLGALGMPLRICHGPADVILAQLHRDRAIGALWSHQETGNGWTFVRDKRIAAWCRDNAIPWYEPRQNGVIRRLRSRNGWARAWDAFMAEPVDVPPALVPVPPLELGQDRIPSARDLGLGSDPCPGRQCGGRQAAAELLDTFLTARGFTYRRAMSSPVTGELACSRLSTHLAWGTISIKEVAQATYARMRDLKADPSPEARIWRAALTSFSGRLHWHCHFMQKLESEPRIEFHNFHPAYDGLRPQRASPTLLDAFAKGETGFPFVDACMRSLAGTGWINFRMRAMLMAFASYHLWLPWRESGLILARLFTDYEPGIHWPQTQMQSGTTGINTVRVYNPVKQGYDQDPEGIFIRRWVPELANVPLDHLHEPWTSNGRYGRLDKVYPDRIVDHLAAAKAAREKVWGVRGGGLYREKAGAIQNRHGSRKSGLANVSRRRASRPAKAAASQLRLDLDGPIT